MEEHAVVLKHAIENRLRVMFNYRGTDEGAATLRIIEPWIYGIRNGKECLLGWQCQPEAICKRFDLRRVKQIMLAGHPSDRRPDIIDLSKWDQIECRWIPAAEHA